MAHGNQWHRVRPATFSIQRKSKLLPSPIGLCPGEGSYAVTPWLSLSQLFIAILSNIVTKICTTAFSSAVSVNFPHQIINGLRPGHVQFSYILLSLFTPTGLLIGDRLNNTQPFAQLPTLFSDSLICFCPLIFFKCYY